jgi:hypothetical protein
MLLQWLRLQQTLIHWTVELSKMANINISQILIKRGNTAAASNYVGPLGELLVDTGLKTVRVQDGVTPGGMAVLATLSGFNQVTSNVTTLQGNVITLQTELSNIAGITGNVAQLETFLANVNLEELQNLVYGNANVAVYLPTDPNILAINANIVAANAAIITANTALKGYTDYQISTAINNLINSAPGTLDTLGQIAANLANESSAIGAITNSITSINASITAANASIVTTNSAIVTANSAMKSYVDAVTTAWTANAATQQTQINNVNANVLAANATIATLQSGTYTNANTAAYLATYLPSYTGNITAGNVTVGNVLATGFFYANGTPFVSSNYGNTQVAAYLTANPQGSTYSNANVTAYLTTQTFYSNSNVASYLISNPQPGTYSNTNVAAYLTTQTFYSDTNVAAYIAGNLSAINANITAANAAIVTANTAMKSYVDNNTSTVTESSTAPSNPKSGALWWDTVSGSTFIYYNGAWVDTAVNFVPATPINGANVPVGGIIMWSGASTAIPYGYNICDGTNSTPDLRGQFVIGAGGSYAVGATGGSSDAVVVSHTHGITDSGHNHIVNSFKGIVTESTGGGYGVFGSGFGEVSGTVTPTTNVSVTGITINSTGSSATNANLPPYYALCYIMRVL